MCETTVCSYIPVECCCWSAVHEVPGEPPAAGQWHPSPVSHLPSAASVSSHLQHQPHYDPPDCTFTLEWEVCVCVWEGGGGGGGAVFMYIGWQRVGKIKSREASKI